MRFTSPHTNTYRSAKIYEYEEKLNEKDTLGALAEVDAIIPSTDIEQNFKVT